MPVVGLKGLKDCTFLDTREKIFNYCGMAYYCTKFMEVYRRVLLSVVPLALMVLSIPVNAVIESRYFEPAFFYTGRTVLNGPPFGHPFFASTPEEVAEHYRNIHKYRSESCLSSVKVNRPCDVFGEGDLVPDSSVATFNGGRPTRYWLYYTKHTQTLLPDGSLWKSDVSNGRIEISFGIRCPEGYPTGNLSGAPNLFFVCVDSKPEPDMCQLDGNPINRLTGDKVQAEVAYRGRAGLTLKHRYMNQRAGWVVQPRPSISLLHNAISVGGQDVLSSNDSYEKCRGDHFNHALSIPNSATPQPEDSILVQVPHCGKYIWRDQIGVPIDDVMVFRDGFGNRRYLKNTNGTYSSFKTGEKMEPVSPANAGKAWRMTYSGGKVDYFNEAGQLVERQSSDKTSVLNYEYEDGNLKSIKNNFSDTLTFEYDDSGKLELVNLPNNSKVRYQFDPVDLGGEPRLTSVTYADSSKQAYLYEDDRYPMAMTGLIDGEDNHLATWEYDEAGLAVISEHDGGKEQFSFDFQQLQSGVSKVTNPLGKQSVYYFEALNSQQRVIKVEGQPTENCAAANQYKSYYPNATIQTQTDWEGNVTHFERDTLGRTTKKTEGQKWPGQPQYGVNVDASALQATANTKITQTCWHPTHNKPERVIEPGRVTIYDYFDSGQLKNKTVEARSTQNSTCAED